MGSEEQALTRRLRMHVEQLAGEIGERNVFSPTALQAIASYIEREWEQQGYTVTQIAYDVSGVPCLNLEITRSGGARQHEILLIGAHYDTVTGSPGANDNASGVSALLELSLRQHRPGIDRPLRCIRQRGAAILHDSPTGEHGVR
jgi:acetylornithine deacetylase/succinyl-diaminopimelate desuccinylase-like protein